MRHSVTAADAEDAAQEALLRAWKARRTCAAAEDPAAYVAAIARNEALRLRDRRTRLAEVAAPEEGTAGRDDDALVDVVERAALRSAFDRLTEHERRLLGLRYVEDLTQPVIARLLGIPEGTVKVQLHRARRKLRQAVEAAARER